LDALAVFLIYNLEDAVFGRLHSFCLIEDMQSLFKFCAHTID